MATETVGFVGVGLMGQGMAKNMVSKGYDVAVIAHRNRGPVEELVAAGATEATSLEALAQHSSVVFICAPGSPQVEDVIAKLRPGLAAGSVVVDCSTADPNSTLRLAASLAEDGVHFADAPLGGTPAQAETGELSAMIGADPAVFKRIEPVISAWAKTIIHLGPVGDGHKMKLLNNFLSLGYGAIYAEAMALGAKVGIDAAKFDSVIRGSRMDCGFYQTFMGWTIDGNRESHKFTLTNAAKDARYLAAMADAAGVSNPVGNAVKTTYVGAVNAGGDGAEDYVPHIVDFVAEANGMPSRRGN